MFDRVLNTVKNIALKKAARKLVIGSRSSFRKNTKWKIPLGISNITKFCYEVVPQ